MHIVSIVIPLSSKTPTITGPIAEDSTDNDIKRLLTDPRCDTPYSSAHKADEVVWENPTFNPRNIM